MNNKERFTSLSEYYWYYVKFLLNSPPSIFLIIIFISLLVNYMKYLRNFGGTIKKIYVGNLGIVYFFISSITTPP